MMLAKSSPAMSARASQQRTAAPRLTSVHSRRPQKAERAVVVRSASSEQDFDALLNKLADKFEKSENKPIVVAYVAAALSAFFVTEWFIHLPALDVLLGFPIQLLGVLALPVLGVRYLVDKVDVAKDVEEQTDKIVKLLPGLKKD